MGRKAKITAKLKMADIFFSGDTILKTNKISEIYENLQNMNTQENIKLKSDGVKLK